MIDLITAKERLPKQYFVWFYRLKLKLIRKVKYVIS